MKTASEWLEDIKPFIDPKKKGLKETYRPLLDTIHAIRDEMREECADTYCILPLTKTQNRIYSAIKNAGKE